MQRAVYFLFFFTLISVVTFGQTVIKGQVMDNKQKPVPFANVYLKDIFDGSTTDEKGKFSFTTAHTGKAVLMVSFTGYQNYEKEIKIVNGVTLEVNPALEEAVDQLDVITISVGAFEASDEKTATQLKPLDIVTTPGASGDVYGALRTVPGVAPENEQTGIFVRGGEARETQTIIDGMLVQNPFFGEVPDIPSRGRFNPLQFKGTMFSTGAYSAEYSQALSSVLLLNTQDLPQNSFTSINLNLVSIGALHTQKFDKQDASVSASFTYTDTELLFLIPETQVDWAIPPQGLSSTLGFRKKFKNGILKGQAQYQSGVTALRFPDLNNPTATLQLENRNNNLFAQTSYSGTLGKKWTLYLGGAYNNDQVDITFDNNEIPQTESMIQFKSVLGTELAPNAFLKFGAETFIENGVFGFNSLSQNVDDNYSAGFVETEITLASKLALRLGGRAEYSSYLQDFRLVPRASLAFVTGKKSQISFGYGQFYQNPDNDFLRQERNLNFEKATHYILNYQYLNDDRTFRIEAYYKDYENLVKVDNIDANRIFNNQGFGFSRGIDVFWRDKKTFKHLDYWLSYSFIDAQRNYLDFPTTATPTFISQHVFSAVFRYGIPLIRTNIGATFSYASSRTYFNPNNPVFLGDVTPSYQSLSINISHITSLFGHFAVFYVSVNNALGRDNIFGYRYSTDGANRRAIRPATRGSFFAGLSMTIMRDR